MQWITTMLQWLALATWSPFLLYWARSGDTNLPSPNSNPVAERRRSSCRHLHVAGILQTALLMFITFCWVGRENCQHLPYPTVSLLHGLVVWLVMHFCWVCRFVHFHAARTFTLWLVLQLHMALFWIESELLMLVLQLVLVIVDAGALTLLFRHTNNGVMSHSSLYFVLQSWPVCILAEAVVIGVGTGRQDVDRFLAVLVFTVLGGSQLWFTDRHISSMQTELLLLDAEDDAVEADKDYAKEAQVKDDLYWETFLRTPEMPSPLHGDGGHSLPSAPAATTIDVLPPQ